MVRDMNYSEERWGNAIFKPADPYLDGPDDQFRGPGMLPPV